MADTRAGDTDHLVEAWVQLAHWSDVLHQIINEATMELRPRRLIGGARSRLHDARSAIAEALKEIEPAGRSKLSAAARKLETSARYGGTEHQGDAP